MGSLLCIGRRNWNNYSIMLHVTQIIIYKKVTNQMMHLSLFTSSKHRNPLERDTLLIPNNYAKTLLSDTHYDAQSDDNDDQYEDTIAPYEPADNLFVYMVHVAPRLTKDLNETDGHTGLNINEDGYINCIPDSLYMFLSMMYGGLDILDKESNYENPRQSQILSVAQDIAYGVSEGKKWTPKHVGLGSPLHQSTRSKKLVNLFHRAGHCLPYTDLHV